MDNNIVKNEIKKCDFLLSIGVHCRPAINLQFNGLRNFASPLDFMGYYSFSDLLHLYETDFSDYFEDYKIDYDKQTTTGNYWVEDMKNHLLSIHHFPKNKNFEETYKTFKIKMNERYQRLKKYLENSKYIVLVGEREETDDEMVKFLISFSKMFPHLKIDLINAVDDKKYNYDEYKTDIIYNDGKILYKKYFFNDTRVGMDVAEGNCDVWSKILNEYETDYSIGLRNEWAKFRNENKNVVVYTKLLKSRIIINWILSNGIKIQGIVNNNNADEKIEIKGMKSKSFFEYPKDMSVIICIDNLKEAEDVKKMLIENGYSKIYIVNKYLRMI